MKPIVPFLKILFVSNLVCAAILACDIVSGESGDANACYSHPKEAVVHKDTVGRIGYQYFEELDLVAVTFTHYAGGYYLKKDDPCFSVWMGVFQESFQKDVDIEFTTHGGDFTSVKLTGQQLVPHSYGEKYCVCENSACFYMDAGFACSRMFFIAARKFVHSVA